jgi:hypothetical protein
LVSKLIISGAEAHALQTLSRSLTTGERREAFGLRAVYRRFSDHFNIQ